MAVKSVIDVEINDEAFKTFTELFEKYQAQVKEQPQLWDKVGESVKGNATSFGDLVAAMMAQSLLLKTMDEKEKERKRNSEKQVSSWKSISKYTKEVKNNIVEGGRALLKWTSILGAVGGLAGVGGLFGLEHLAAGVGAGRRSSLGLGLNYGEQKAFDINYGRLVDSGQILSGVNEALHDVTKRYTLYAAGLTDKDIGGKSTGQIGSMLLPYLKRLADTTPTSVLQQTIDARGLSQFVSLQDMMRLRGTSSAELADLQKSYGQDSRDLSLDVKTQIKWQMFSAQLTRAGNKIETVFVNGLTPLAGPLSKLSESVASSLETLMKSIKPSDVEAIGKGIENFAKYLASDDFRKDLRDFASDVSTLAGAVADALRELGKHTVRDAAFGAVAGFAMGGPGGAVVGGLVGGGVGVLRDGGVRPGDRPYSRWTDTDPNRDSRWYDPGSWMSRNGGIRSWFGSSPNASNPGNLRNVGGNGFQQFASRDDGIRAMANQLLRYQTAKWGNKDTLAKIIGTYAPPNENDTRQYIDFVSKKTGINPNAKIDLRDKSTMSKVIAAMLKMENSKNRDTQESVARALDGSAAKKIVTAIKNQPQQRAVVTVNNNTGGSAVITANQAAH